MTESNRRDGRTRKKVEDYVAGRLAWENQSPYSPPDDGVGQLKYKQGYEDARARSERGEKSDG